MSRMFIVLLALDHAILAAATLGNCKPYEMISSALWSLEQDGKRIGLVLRPIVDLILSPRTRDHCRQSWVWQQEIFNSKFYK